MCLVYTFLAEGFEEVEALAVVDVLRRAKIDVKTVSVGEKLEVISSHNVTIKADIMFDEADFDSADMLFLPGGIPGTPNLAAHKGLVERIIEFNEKGKKLAAICAAPSVYGELGILKGKNVTCFPGYEDKLIGANYLGTKFVTDGNISTGKGMGATVELGLEIVRIFKGQELADTIAKKIQFI